MDIAALNSLLGSMGTAGVFLAACWYLMRRMETKEEERAKESREREARMLESLSEADKNRSVTETFIRTTFSSVIAESSKANSELARAVERLPCQQWRTDDIERIMKDRRAK